MSGILRIYDPAECDAAGVPLDWERCRKCDGGRIPPLQRFEASVPIVPAEGERIGARIEEPCGACGGYGSLKAAVLAGRWCVLNGCPCQDGDPCNYEPHDGSKAMRRHYRCESCGHPNPMSEGTWDAPQGAPGWGPPDPVAHALYLAAVERHLRESTDPRWAWVHYSPCDEGCRHGGPGRAKYGNGPCGGSWVAVDLDAVDGADRSYEASWRQVTVRRLGEPNDLRPENLVVLCLRCYADTDATKEAMA